MSLKIKVDQKESGVFVITMVGSIDTETYGSLDKAVSKILDSYPKGIIFNMEGVSYVSSMGLSVMFKTKKSIEKIKGALIMTNLRPQIKKVFDSVKFMPTSTFENLTEANKYLDDFLRFIQREKEEPVEYPFMEYGDI